MHHSLASPGLSVIGGMRSCVQSVSESRALTQTAIVEHRSQAGAEIANHREESSLRVRVRRRRRDFASVHACMRACVSE
eukprot:641707-Rhodomonas_salina.1